MRIKNFIRKNYKVGMGFILGIVVCIGIGVRAVTTKEVGYDNSTSNLTSTNMQGAIDELNTKADTIARTKPCKVIKGTGTEVGDEIACGTEEFYVLKSAGDSIKTLTKYGIECNYDFSTGQPIAISNPSYLQTENDQNLGGYPAFPTTKYRENLIEKIGLSNGVLVEEPSFNNLNNTICSYTITYHQSATPSYNISNISGSCPNISKVAGNTRFWVAGSKCTNDDCSSTIGIYLSTSGIGFEGFHVAASKLIVTIPKIDIL